MTNPTIKRHWTTEHYPNAVPLDLWELIRALTYQMNLTNKEPPEKRLTPESFQEKIKYYTQFETKLDALVSHLGVKITTSGGKMTDVDTPRRKLTDEERQKKSARAQQRKNDGRPTRVKPGRAGVKGKNQKGRKKGTK